VTQEILAAVDWLPTLAGLIGASDLVPKDRPIDGVDASAFMLGKTNTTGRDDYMFFGNDGELMSVKWKILKVIYRYTESKLAPAIESAYIKPQWPMMYDLSSDPHEDNNLWISDLCNGWMFGPFTRIVMEYQRSIKEYPNIKPGEEFAGYSKPK
jgi:arylsulfatase